MGTTMIDGSGPCTNSACRVPETAMMASINIGSVRRSASGTSDPG